MKAVTFQHIKNNTNSFCFAYGEYPILVHDVFVDTKEGDIRKFFQTILLYVKEAFPTNEIYDFILIYTNEAESDLRLYFDDLIMLELNRYCRCVIVACKEG